MGILLKRNQRFHFSPLRYPGGKSFLFPLFSKLIQRQGSSITTYVEPFAGGAGAAIALLFLEKVERIVINDLDKAIYSFWMSAIFQSARFIDKILSTSVTIKEWRRQRAIYWNAKSSLFDLGFATFFMNRTNVSGIVNGGPIGGIKQESKWPIHARFNRDNLVDRVEKLSEYAKRISVYNKDGYQLINQFLKQKDAIIYLDPPYFEKGSSLYLNHYSTSDHKKLSDKLNANSKSKWVLTYDDAPEIKMLYKNRQIQKFSLYHNAYESRIGKEVLILSEPLSI